jgi:hypothetical protein
MWKPVNLTAKFLKSFVIVSSKKVSGVSVQVSGVSPLPSWRGSEKWLVHLFNLFDWFYWFYLLKRTN